MKEHIDEVWRTFFHPVPDPKREPCAVAATFAAWTVRVIAQEHAKGTEESTNRALLQLQMRFWECYRELPSKHKRRISKPDHTCIFQVYEEAYEALRAVQLSLLPKGPPKEQAMMVPPLQPRWQFFGDPVTEDEE